MRRFLHRLAHRFGINRVVRVTYSEQSGIRTYDPGETIDHWSGPLIGVRCIGCGEWTGWMELAGLPPLDSPPLRYEASFILAPLFETDANRKPCG